MPTKTERQYSEAEHLDVMRHFERWPLVILPMQHKSRLDPVGHGVRLLGFMRPDAEEKEAAPTVYLAPIFYRKLGLKLEDIPVETYPDLEAVFAAGWEVD